MTEASWPLRVWAASLDIFFTVFLHLFFTFFIGALSAGFLNALGLGPGEGFWALFWLTISKAWIFLWFALRFCNGVLLQWGLGGSIGKLALGMRVLTIEGGPPAFWQIFWRYFFRWVSILPMGLGYLAPLWTQKKQTFHDYFFKTVVVKEAIQRRFGHDPLFPTQPRNEEGFNVL